MRLEVRRLCAWYGAARVLFDVDVQVGAGEAVAVVGANGAGKTTLLRSVMGIGGVTRSGSVRVDGRETIGMQAHEVARLGVGLVAEGGRVFEGLTVSENLAVAAGASGRRPAWPLERVWEAFPLLARVRGSRGAWLSGGERQTLAIARALMGDPCVLLLDEPSQGLAPRVMQELIEQLGAVRGAGVAVLLAEQHRGLVQALAARAYVLDRGAISWEGPARALFGAE